MGADICLDQKGEPMLVHDRILDTKGNPVAGAKIDVWLANDRGFYDVQQMGLQRDFNLRGVFRTGADGAYHFRGVKPKLYPIPDDGPVGKRLASLGRPPYRLAHLHYIIDAEGFGRSVTDTFDPDAPYIQSDAVFGVKESLMAEFQLTMDPARIAKAGFAGPYYDTEFDFVLGPIGAGPLLVFCRTVRF